MTKKRKSVIWNCKNCQQAFKPFSNNQRFCTKKCREDYFYKNNSQDSEKECPGCGLLKNQSFFVKDKTKPGGLSSRCKDCARKYRYNYYWENPELGREKSTNWRRENLDKKNSSNRFRYLLMQKSVPKWADKDEIDYIYSLAREKGLEVDHLVPLTSNEVCGLHTGDNLRCIPADLNRRKSNHYWPDMWR